MQENSNKAIVVNSVILITKLCLNTVCSLLTTRFALKALGINDFGLFSLLGSVISFIAIFNTIMVATSNRYISVAIGKGNVKAVNEQFNICLVIHVFIAIACLIIAIPLGDFYIHNYLNYSGEISKAIDVFHITIVGSILSFISVPFHGLLMAKEKFFIFSLTDVICHIIKLIICYLLVFYFNEKLLIYAVTLSVLTVAPTLVYMIYCYGEYSELVRLNISRDKTKYKEIFSFSGWVAYGAIAVIGKNQGAAIIVNSFFNTAMNSALGLANTVSGLLITFSNSIAQPISPQITKCYASGNNERCDELLIMSTKYTFLATLIISVPFLSNAEWMFELWLGNVPPYVVPFTLYLIIDTLITSLNSGISNLIFASGKIKLYQISINTLRFLSVIAAYVMLRIGGPAYSLLWAYIGFSVIIFFVCQFVLYKTLNYDNVKLWRNSYVPSILVVALLIPVLLLNSRMSIAPVVRILMVEMYLLGIIYVIGLSSKEKTAISGFIHKIMKK